MNALAGVGILGKHATLNCNACVSETEAKQIAEALVHLSRTINTSQTKEFLLNQRRIIPTNLKLKGKVYWDSTLPTNASAAKETEAWRVVGFQQHPQQGAAYFGCPSCAHVESSQCGPFQHMDLDYKITCNGCQNTSKVVMWKCGCERFWHRCPLHRGVACNRDLTTIRLKTRKQTSLLANTGKKARPHTQVGPDSHQWLLAQDVACAKRKRDFVENWESQPSINLGYTRINKINPAFLSPSLKRRFVDVNSSA